MTLLDFSQQIFGNKGNNYSPAQIAATETNGADVLYGTAQLDADSGEVEVLIDGTEIPTDPDDPDYGLASTMTCDTEELIQAGDRVTVVRNGQNAKAIVLTPESTGVAAAAQAADDAAKTATDFLTMDETSGLTVGASSLDKSVNINAGGMDVLDGSDVIAHYGSYVGLGGGNGNDGIMMAVDSPSETTGYGDSAWWAITNSIQMYNDAYWNVCLDSSAEIYNDNLELVYDAGTHRICTRGFYEPSLGLYLPPLEIQVTPYSDHAFTRTAGISIDIRNFTSLSGYLAYSSTWYDDINAHTGEFTDCLITVRLLLPAHMSVNGSVDFANNLAGVEGYIDENYAGIQGYRLHGLKGGVITSRKDILLDDEPSFGTNEGIVFIDERDVIWDSTNNKWIVNPTPTHPSEEQSFVYINADNIDLRGDNVMVNGSPIGGGGGGSVKTAIFTMSSDMSGLNNTQKRVLFDSTSDSSVATVSSGMVTVAEAGTYVVLGQCTVQGANNTSHSYGMRMFSDATVSGSGLSGGTQLCYAGCYGYLNGWITMTGFGIATLAAGGTLGMTIQCSQTDNSALTKGNKGTHMLIMKVA